MENVKIVEVLLYTKFRNIKKSMPLNSLLHTVSNRYFCGTGLFIGSKQVCFSIFSATKGYISPNSVKIDKITSSKESF